MSDRFAMPARIVKSDAKRQIVYAVALEPRTRDNPDTQGDYYSAMEVEKAAHRFMAAVAKGEAGSDVLHDDGPIVGYPVESFIAPVDFVMGDGDRMQIVKAGSWVLGVHVPDTGIWKSIESGELDAFSVYGAGKRIYEEATA